MGPFEIDREQEAKLREGVVSWNAWRASHAGPEIALSGVLLDGANLDGVDLSGARLHMASLNRCSLVGANMDGAHLDDVRLEEADLSSASLKGASLRGVRLRAARLDRASLRSSVLWRADLSSASLRFADLSETQMRDADLSCADAEAANFQMASLNGVRFIRTRLVRADLRYAYVFGVAVWDADLTGANQEHLRVTEDDMGVVVDDLALAQIVHLLISGSGVARLLSATTKRIVLILGRFSGDRKPFLDILKAILGHLGYVPILFDFAAPEGRDSTETVRAIAHMARFIVADLCDPRCVPQELTTIVPHLPSVPLVPVIESSQEPWGMFDHFARYSWVLPVQTIPGRGSGVDPAEFVNAIVDRVVVSAEVTLLGDPLPGSLAPSTSAPPRLQTKVLARYLESRPVTPSCVACGSDLSVSYESSPNDSGLWETFCSHCGVLNGVPKRWSGRRVTRLTKWAQDNAPDVAE